MAEQLYQSLRNRERHAWRGCSASCIPLGYLRPLEVPAGLDEAIAISNGKEYIMELTVRFLRCLACDALFSRRWRSCLLSC